MATEIIENNNMILQVLKRLAVSDGERQAPTPNLPGGKDMQRYLIAAMVAALPCFAVAVYYFGSRILAMTAVAFFAIAAVEVAFGLVRGKPIGGGALVFAILLVLILPPEIPLWMVAIGAAFGAFFGKEVFGGTGHHLFSPVLLAKGFLMFSYPLVIKGSYFGSMLDFNPPEAWMICAGVTLLGAVAMIIIQPANVLTLAGIFFAAGCFGWGLGVAGRLGFESPIQVLVVDGFLYGACFLACDPSCSPGNGIGKLIYGVLIGSIAVLMRCFSNYSEAIMSAILIGNLFTPIINIVTQKDEGLSLEKE
ncbi:MAG: RnfABCDGE type electron transport complex subunit D [Phycisphaerae bacterium]|nr:RnfABCDGE type electron transport complex subunit D [Phycisphaerae bacterium]